MTIFKMNIIFIVLFYDHFNSNRMSQFVFKAEYSSMAKPRESELNAGILELQIGGVVQFFILVFDHDHLGLLKLFLVPCMGIHGNLRVNNYIA